MPRRSYYLVNGITLYRMLAAPALILLIFTHHPDPFKWLLAISFCTDLIDGWLARKYKVISAFGSRLDSIADDLTIVAAVVGAIVFKPEFIREELPILLTLLFLFVIQTVLALVRYRRISSFHTYAAKVAAILQGIFLILLFLLSRPLYLLFYLAAWVTMLDLVEEIVLVLLLPKWETNVKGLYWVLKRK